MIEDMAVFDTLKPANPLPLVFDSPHSGTNYPDDFNYSCGFKILQCAEDKYVDELFINAPEHGGYLLRALFPRAYIDPNRAIDDIDPSMLAGDWPYGEINPTARSDAGIGLIRRLVEPGKPLYNHPLTAEQIQHRITQYYQPYHTELCKIINETHYNFGQVFHINCHSMPSASSYPKNAPRLVGNEKKPSDIVLSNRDGLTCDTAFMHACRDFFRQKNLSVSLNDPYKGAELIERYNSPARGRHSLQIEINRSLYMNEETCEKHSGFAQIQTITTDFIKFCAAYAQSQFIDRAAD